MKELVIEGRTFVSAYIPLNDNEMPGIDIPVIFQNIPDSLDEYLIAEEDRLWDLKQEDAAKKGQVLTRGKQYGVVPSFLKNRQLLNNGKIIIPASEITYARIGLCKVENNLDIPNVLALSEIITGPKQYMFVERGGKLAYYNGESQMHALVAGNYPRNIKFICSSEMTIEKWLGEQQKTEHGIMPTEVYNRKFLGIILDKTLGYKPDIIFQAETFLSGNDLKERHALDAWEKKGIRKFPNTVDALTEMIIEHAHPDRHVPPGYGGAIIELARIGGIEALDPLKKISIDYKII